MSKRHKWHEYVILALAPLAGGLLLAGLFLIYIIVNGSLDVAIDRRVLLNFPGFKKLLPPLYVFSVFCWIILSSKDKTSGVWLQIVTGIAAGALIPFLCGTVTYIILGAILGGILGLTGKYWIRILDGL